LPKQSPGFDWDRFLRAAGLERVATVVSGPAQLRDAAAQALADTPLPVLKRYLKVRLLDSVADVLPQFVSRRALRISRQVAARDGTGPCPAGNEPSKGRDALGEAVGQAYVARYFPPDYKARALALVQNLIGRLSRIDRRPGLDDGPDQAARAREAGQVHAEDRLPGEVARLFQAADQRERRTGQTSCAPDASNTSARAARIGQPSIGRNGK